MHFESYIVLGIMGAVYLLPGIVASLRRHHNAGAVWLTTILLGWTGFGWIVALIWSATAVRSTTPPPVRHPQYSAAYRELAGLK